MQDVSRFCAFWLHDVHVQPSGQNAACEIAHQHSKNKAAQERRQRERKRDALRVGDAIEGPAAIEEAGTTTVIDVGDVLRVEDHGCLVIDIAKGVSA